MTIPPPTNTNVRRAFARRMGRNHGPEVDMSLQMYADVILTRDVPESGLRAGDVGAVVERLVVSGVPEEGYSVEFFDMTGNAVAVVLLPASALRLPSPADRPAVRALSA